MAIHQPTKHAYEIIREARSQLDASRPALAYLTQPVRHAFLCREVCSILAARPGIRPEVVAELMDQLVRVSSDKDL